MASLPSAALDHPNGMERAEDRWASMAALALALTAAILLLVTML